jgi:signal transduction histidine kinase
MPRSSLLVLMAGVVLGAVAESAAFDFAELRLWITDLLVGWTFIGCGLVAAVRRPDARSGTLMTATGFTWFLGNFAGVEAELISWVAGNAIYVHRGPLVHLILTYPSGRATSTPARVAVAAGYVAALVPAVWDSEVATLLLSALLIAFSAQDYARSVGQRRRPRGLALWAAVGLSTVLAGGAIARITLPSGDVGSSSLLAYELTLGAIAVCLMVGLITAPWERTDVTDIVLQLGASRSRTLRDALARALGDETLEVGYWIAETGEFVDSQGRVVPVPGPASVRSVTLVQSDGEPIAMIVHDPVVLEDPALRTAVSSAARLAAVNARLQAEVRARVTELELSRQRILDARDEEHRRLERRIHDGAERRLEAVAEDLRRGRRSALPGPTSERIESAEAQIARTIEELGRLARGLHPRALTEHGLETALMSVVERFPIPIEIEVSGSRLPPTVEAATYFICAEALVNVAKHASASKASVCVVAAQDARVAMTIKDNGVGGADPTRGSGLRGLADRVTSLNGTLQVDSPPGRGTRLTAEIPLGGEATQ